MSYPDEVRQAIEAEAEVLVSKEMRKQNISEIKTYAGSAYLTKDECRSIVKAIVNIPGLMARWSKRASIPTVDQAWRERAVARLASEDRRFFDIAT